MSCDSYDAFDPDPDPGNNVVGLSLNIRRKPGPGLLESKYYHCLLQEMRQDGPAPETNVTINDHTSRRRPRFKADVLIDGKMIVEMKSRVRPAKGEW